MEYHEVEPISREEVSSILRSGDLKQIPLVLLRLAFYESDWRWVQDECIRFSDHSDIQIRYMATLCLGHLGRIHRKLELDKVMPVLLRLLEDPAVSGTAQDAIDDIEQFVPLEQDSH